ncbi:MAG: ATP-NAD kinase family protein [Candidatus Altiarchaeota archaeon]
MKVGFLINPIAGMGGRVGLKGTDGVLDEAIRRGAKPVSEERAKKALEDVTLKKTKFLTSSNEMGEEILKERKIPNVKVIHFVKGKSSSRDTKQTSKKFLKEKVDLVLFCGGDGTARDVYSIVGDKVPILGIPAGVKMHSSVFAVSPQAAGEILMAFAEGKAAIGDGDVMDIDEDAFRKNRVSARLYGVAKTPLFGDLIQAGKLSFAGSGEEESKKGITKFASEFLHDDELVILGSGSTVASVAEKLGVEKTLLGVDVLKGGKIVAKDVNENQLLEILKNEKKIQLLVSPIGAQGFIFGRGNQQLSPKVLKKVGLKNIIILATPEKIASFDYLRVDTGDEKLDKELSGSRQVVCGYRMAARKEVVGGA